MSARHSTKIIATVGPASRETDMLARLIKAGVDVFRINFSYGTDAEHAGAIKSIRRAARTAGKPIAIMQDLQGAKVRIGQLATTRVLSKGDVLSFVSGLQGRTSSHVPVDFPHLADAVSIGDRILLGDGEAELTVVSVMENEVQVVSTRAGRIRPRQGLNVIGVSLARGATTENDRRDLAVGVDLGVDYVALSFVRSGDDVRALKDLIHEYGADIPVVAKIETRDAISDLDDVLSSSDAVMVARGDLGLAFTAEEVPRLQKQIIRVANIRGIPVITATQMLESMIAKPTPTRAEASDVANAILDGSDAVMLSAETAIGDYPVEAVQTIGRLAIVTEPDLRKATRPTPPATHPEAMSRAACDLARDLGASAIVIFTRSGYSARLVSRERPAVPIIAFTPSEDVGRRLALWFGVRPVLAGFPNSAEEMIARMERWMASTTLEQNSLVVLAHWSEGSEDGWTNFVKLHRLTN